MSKTKRRPDPSPPEPVKEGAIHIRTDPEFRAELDKIVGWMQSDPNLRRLKIKPGREKALRYAVGRLIASPPEHVGAERG